MNTPNPKKFDSLMNVFMNKPTLPLFEWMIRYLSFVVVSHAKSTNEMLLLLSSLVSSVVSEHMLFNNTSSLLNGNKSKEKSNDVRIRYDAQSTIMVSERDPLWRIEKGMCLLYVASIAAKQYNIGQSLIGNASLAALFYHLLSFPCEVNGTRFLWFTWHDSHPFVLRRILGVPVSSLMSSLAVGLSHSLLIRWAFTSTEEISKILVKGMEEIPSYQKSIHQSISGIIEIAHKLISQIPDVPRALIVSTIGVPAFTSIILTLSQLFSIDEQALGCPSSRSYKLLLTLLVGSALSGLRDRALKSGPDHSMGNKLNEPLAATCVAYFSTQMALSFFGDSQRHISTGFHQTYGQQGILNKTRGGMEYETNISDEGPTGASKSDFTIEAVRKKELLKKIEDYDDALKMYQRFTYVANKRVNELEEVLKNAASFKSEAEQKLSGLRIGKKNSFGTMSMMQDMESSTSIHITALKKRIDIKVEQARAHATRLLVVESKIRTMRDSLTTEYERISKDPSGSPIVEPTEGSDWYTIRGQQQKNSYEKERIIATLCLSIVGIISFSKAFNNRFSS